MAMKRTFGERFGKEKIELAKTTKDKALLTRLANDESEIVRESVASNINTPPEVLGKLCDEHDTMGFIMCNALKNPHCPSDALARIAEYYKDYFFEKTVEDEFLLAYIAKNPNTPSETLTMLANCSNLGWCARELAVNPKLSLEASKVIYRRSRDEGGILASHTPHIEILEFILSEEYGRRYLSSCVCRNPNVPLSILERLSNDKDQYVLEAIAESRKADESILAKISKSEFVKVRLAVANNPNTSSLTLEHLCNDGSCDVLNAIAKSPKADKTILDKLSKSTIVDVRMNVVSNPNTSRETLSHLTRDKSSHIREFAGERLRSVKVSKKITYGPKM